MTKLEGPTCPKCGATGTCRCRCNYCHEQLNDGWKNNDGQQVMNPRTGRAIPHDMYNQPHNDCMKKGTGGKYYKGGEQVYVNEKSKDLGDYMKNMARLGADGFWHGWRDGKYVGRIEKATKEAYQSWEPIQQEVQQ